jgi:hypothetical protein
MQRIPSHLNHLSSLRIAITFLYWLHIKEIIGATPLVFRLTLLYSGVLFAGLFVLPPIDQIPHIMLPITWAAAYCVTLILYTFMIFIKKNERAK